MWKRNLRGEPFLNECIHLGFRNDKALLDEKILSESEFPLKIFCEEDGHIYVILNYGKNKVVLEKYTDALADYIINRYEKKLVLEMLSKKYEEIPSFTKGEILKGISEFDTDSDVGKKCRQEIIKEELYDYFKEFKKGSIEGLLIFRMPKYLQLLDAFAEQLMESYYAEREYEEFIGLLKYFVSVQTERPSITHLVVKKIGGYSVLDEKKKDITAKCISDFAPLDELGYNNFDDLLISILITLAPQKIIVHNSEYIKNDELFKTISRVFENVRYCTGCEIENKIEDKIRLQT